MQARSSVPWWAVLVLVLAAGIVVTVPAAQAVPRPHDDDVAVNLSVLEEARRDTDRVPMTALKAVSEQGDPESARLLASSEAGRFSVFAGRDGGICLLGMVAVRNSSRDEVMWTHAVTCTPPGVFARRGGYLSLGADSEQHAVHVVPDGVQAFVSDGPGTDLRPLPVERNHLAFGPFAVDGDGWPDATLVLADGDRSTELTLPAAAVAALREGR